MKNIILQIVFIGVIAAIIFILTQTGGTVASDFAARATGGTGPGNVLIELKPHIEDGKLNVDVSVNTHSVDLTEFDLMELVLLKYDSKTIKPISAPTLSGHHSNGVIVFAADVNEKFVITIQGIPDVEERVFEWV